MSAARAVAAVDYAGGILNTSPAWQDVSPLSNEEMLQARLAVREVLGIPPTVPSQAVVNRMIGVSLALSNGDRAAALNYLSAPFFTLGPQQTSRAADRHALHPHGEYRDDPG